MAYEWMPDADFGLQELATLERGYRRDLQDVAAARACCASLRQVTDRDEQEILRALARIELLRRRVQQQSLDERFSKSTAA